MNAIDVLYEWYQQEFQRTEESIQQSGIRVLLKYDEKDYVASEISRDEFGTRLRSPWQTHSTKQAWINRFMAGHESETGDLDEELQSFLKDCRREVPTSLDAAVLIRPPHFNSSDSRIARSGYLE